MLQHSTVLKIFLLNFWISTQQEGVNSIKDVKIDFSMVVSIGESVTMDCKFNLENESLYSVKLYKGSKEFLHFIPEFSPPYSVYNVKGVDVHSTNMSLDRLRFEYSGDSLQSLVSLNHLKNEKIGFGSIRVLMAPANLLSQGLYGCEVSADSPSWDTQIVRRRLHVLVEPTTQPEINGIEANYKSGQNLHLTCISKDTYPAANITWYMAGRKVESAGSDQLTESSGLITTRSYLNISINHSTEIKCLSSLWTHHYQSKNYALLVKDPPVEPVKTNQTEHISQAIRDQNSSGSGVEISHWIILLFSSIIQHLIIQLIQFLIHPDSVIHPKIHPIQVQL
ncbi:uncharacterized protein LOC111705820 [Eurytemora carolleeae]|uniref:uncharacterized protein LOC111705820 n=1 Tax=Eurytemora carolleeae TaxID=1294199 RepID=UPI000C755AAA|nr:uncharacterized protein LOC111705820 [Eurytemora carolleeae]|eukprot:XP_023334267.1 uncharacterized protein LOC111705820 [Eurytemora affinis]